MSEEQKPGIHAGKALKAISSVIGVAILELAVNKYFDFSLLVPIIKFIQQLMIHTLPIWVVLMLIMVGFFLLYFHYKRELNFKEQSYKNQLLAQQLATSIPASPAYMNYREDTFGADKTIWRWGYINTYEGIKLDLNTVRPACPRCNGTLIKPEYAYPEDMWECPSCRLNGNSSPVFIKQTEKDVAYQILRNVNEKRY